VTLLVAPCSFDAAKYAVMRWHYSHAMPAGKLVKFGVWEKGPDSSPEYPTDRFVGTVLFGRGANNHMGEGYGLDATQLCELVRIALTDHQHPVTEIVAETLRQLHTSNPGLRLVVSFADPDQDHHGGIYQAGNWIYTGMSLPAPEYVVNGERVHGRTLRSMRNSSADPGDFANVQDWAAAHLDPNAHIEYGSRKHRYLMPLDRAMRRQVMKLAQTPPTRVESDRS